ncbi:MAG: glutamate dehydrogenase [Candidatus Dormibacteraeota bacterium]|nr:glutamate dehydrogenase [Candidatus Dormibacteraeota bacterium]
MDRPFLSVTWTDPVTGRQGHLVIDRLGNGISGGGIRMRDGCTLEEVQRLAYAMSLKNGGLNLPAGGAKCGLDMDPHDPGAEAMLVRFVKTMRPVLETYMATGEDMGTTAEQLSRVFGEAGFDWFAVGLKGNPNAKAEADRIRAAFSTSVEGIPLFDLVGGYGVAEAAAAAIEHSGGELVGTRVAIQGFGSMGGSAARYLALKGARIVAVADALGTIVNPKGLDVERLIASRNELGEIDRAAGLGPGDSQLDRELWLSQDSDLLIPAAIADSINAGNCDRVRARLIVEAANIPTTAEAEARLHSRGVVVIPDFIANSGTNGWAWWSVLGQVEPGAEAAFARISGAMRRTVIAMLDLAASERITPREAATRVALANAERHAAAAPPVRA